MPPGTEEEAETRKPTPEEVREFLSEQPFALFSHKKILDETKKRSPEDSFTGCAAESDSSDSLTWRNTELNKGYKTCTIVYDMEPETKGSRESCFRVKEHTPKRVSFSSSLLANTSRALQDEPPSSIPKPILIPPGAERSSTSGSVPAHKSIVYIPYQQPRSAHDPAGGPAAGTFTFRLK